MEHAATSKSASVSAALKALPQAFSALLPADVAGKSILIVGAVENHVPRTLAAAGAAVSLAGISPRIFATSHDGYAGISFDEVDIERNAPASRHDYVVCLRSFVHLRNPLAVLERLAQTAREGLSFIVSPPLSLGRASLDGGKLAYPLLKQLAGMFLVPANRKKGMDQAFFIGRKLTAAFIKSMRQDFASLERLDGARAGEDLFIARKRRIGHLYILAGVNAVGKSTLLDKLRSSQRNDVADMLDFDLTRPWLFTTYAHLLKNSDVQHHPYLMVQYNITAPLVHGTMHGHHHGLLDLILCAEKTTVATMWLDPERQRERYFSDRIPTSVFSPQLHAKRKTAKHLDVHGREGGFSEKTVRPNLFYFRSPYTRRKAERLMGLYGNSQSFIDMYAEWFDFVEQHADLAPVLFQEPSYRVASIADWRTVAGLPG